MPRSEIDNANLASSPCEELKGTLTYGVIEKLLKEEVAPHLNAHGGGIQLVGVEGTTVTVRVTGACHSCPSLHETLEEVVMKTVQERLGVPSLKVVLEQGVSLLLIQEALKIIRR